jgi:hypothetical protein
VGVEVGVGVEAGRERGTQISYEAGPGQDVVFAYQLHVVTYKGWRKRVVDVSVHKTKAAFLREDDGVAGDEEVEVVAADEEDMREFDGEMPVTALSARDGEEECVCLRFDDE